MWDFGGQDEYAQTRSLFLSGRSVFLLAVDLGAELVVNLGDLMRRWTNDRWASTLHRVVVPPPDRLGSCRRQSIAFFNNINPDFVVDSIPTCTDDTAGASRYEPIRAWDFLMEKHHAATGGKRGYLGDEEE